MFARESIARYAPLGDMALSFDGQYTVANGDLPPGLLPCGDNCVLPPFTLTFWMNVPAPPAGATGDAATRPGQSVVEISALDTGMLASWSVALVDADGIRSLALTWQLTSTVLSLTVPAEDYTGRWVYVASSYRPAAPAGADDYGLVTLDVCNGGPDLEHDEAQLPGAATSPDVARRLTLGTTMDRGGTRLGAYRGRLARIRLYNTALDRDQALAAMYNFPLGPYAMVSTALIGDWRLSEGYGSTAFDYSGRPSSVDRRYRPPDGNHLRLGSGEPGTEPAWVVADLITLVGKSAHTQPPPAGPLAASLAPVEPTGGGGPAEPAVTVAPPAEPTEATKEPQTEATSEPPTKETSGSTAPATRRSTRRPAKLTRRPK